MVYTLIENLAVRNLNVLKSKMLSNLCPINETPDAGIQSIYSYFTSLISSKIEEYASIKIRLRIPLVPLEIVFSIFNHIIELFKEEPNVVKIESDVVVVGDLCGHFLDLLRILRCFGGPDVQKYLFLGNLIHPSNYKTLSLETLLYIYTMKILYPQNVFILRGTNEFPNPQSIIDIISNYYEDANINTLINTAFLNTPFGAIIQHKAGNILCLHGGISQIFEEITEFDGINRASNHPNKILLDVIFSSPTDALPMFLPSSKGYGCLYGSEAIHVFLDKNKLSLLIRGHSPVSEGFEYQLQDQIVSVFSSSNADVDSVPMHNKCGVFHVSDVCKGISFDPITSILRTDAQIVESDKQDVFVSNQKSFLSPSVPSTRNILHSSGRSIIGGLPMRTMNTNSNPGRSAPPHRGSLLNNNLAPRGKSNASKINNSTKRASAKLSRQNLVLDF